MCAITLDGVHNAISWSLLTPIHDKIDEASSMKSMVRTLPPLLNQPMSIICPLVGHYNQHSHHLKILAPPIKNQIFGKTCNLVQTNGNMVFIPLALKLH
jgi:hypothetical protein